LRESGIYLALVTPGAHIHWGYGGIASLDPQERENADIFGKKAVDLAYGALRENWHPDEGKFPTLVLWNGSWGYDLASPVTKQMYANLKESLAGLCKYEEKKGGKLYIGIEPKPNEGHPAMLIPTVASALLLWRKLEEEYGIDRDKKGVNKEFGHSEMIGLDHVYDTVEEIDNNGVSHMHVNSQGYNDGIILGGPGKYDIDYGCRINGMNLAIAALVKNAGYNRWKGHDMQTRAYDNQQQGIDRVVRSILSWESCEKAAADFDTDKLNELLSKRETAKAEDMIRKTVTRAFEIFDGSYKK
jgi:xylose isomerase